MIKRFCKTCIETIAKYIRAYQIDIFDTRWKLSVIDTNQPITIRNLLLEINHSHLCDYSFSLISVISY